MNTKLIKTEADYQEALQRLASVFDAPMGTPESDEADLLAMLVDEYEKRHYPIEAIKIRTEKIISSSLLPGV